MFCWDMSFNAVGPSPPSFLPRFLSIHAFLVRRLPVLCLVDYCFHGVVGLHFYSCSQVCHPSSPPPPSPLSHTHCESVVRLLAPGPLVWIPLRTAQSFVGRSISRCCCCFPYPRRRVLCTPLVFFLVSDIYFLCSSIWNQGWQWEWDGWKMWMGWDGMGWLKGTVEGVRDQHAKKQGRTDLLWTSHPPMDHHHNKDLSLPRCTTQFNAQTTTLTVFFCFF